MKHYAIIACLLTLWLSTSCLQATSPTRVSDDSGSSLELAQPAHRLISLSPSNTEMVYYLGLQDRLVGVTEFCNYPPEAKNKPQVGGFSTVDVEKVISQQPDLVLASDIHSKSVTPMLQKLGFSVVTFQPKTLEGVIGNFELLASLCGTAPQSAEKISSLKNRMDAIASLTQGLPEDKRPATLVVIWHDPLMAAGRDTLVDDIIRLTGGRNIARDISGYASLSIEAVLNADPEVIIIPTSMGEAGIEIWDAVTGDARLQDVTAIRKGTIYKIDGDVILRYGPRSFDALEQMASLIHPELFRR